MTDLRARIALRLMALAYRLGGSMGGIVYAPHGFTLGGATVVGPLMVSGVHVNGRLGVTP